MASASEFEELQRQNRALDEQVRALVRSELQLHLTRRSHEQQLTRMKALDLFALDASSASTAEAVLRRSAQMLTSVFALDEAVGLLRPKGAGHLEVVFEFTGRGDQANDRVSPRARTSLLPVVGFPPGPLLTTAPFPDQLPAAQRTLLAFADELLMPGGAAPHSVQSPYLLLPLWSTPESLLGALVLRRVGNTLAYHDILPAEADLDFLALAARHTATAARNAELIVDLRQSYAALHATQQSLLEKERLAAVGEMAAVMAHEVRNPLGVMFNVLSSLKKTPSAAGGSPLLDILSEEASRLNVMVEELLLFARPQPPALAPEAVGPMVRAALDAARRAAASALAHEVHVEEEPNLPEVPMDGRMVRQALVNLMVNAFQAMPGRGTLRVTSRRERHGAGHWLRIDVSDSGPGIAPEIRARLFQPFFTTRAKGTGLGLAIVRRFIEAHRGEVMVESAVGRGSVFSVRLPLSA